jgi:DNA-binding transcriptional MerR regulator
MGDGIPRSERYVNRRYRVQEFAELVGVTVKTLQHYDRLSLLKPSRTAAGYRLYTDRDRERLHQIAALKFLGLPLRQIKQVLDGDTLPLADALRVQREALAAERDRLDRAIHAIERAETAVARGEAEASILTQLTEVIMGNEAEAMKKYFSEAAWAAWHQYFHDWPPPAWRELYEDVIAALDEDPGGEVAEALLARSFALWSTVTNGDRQLQREIHDGMWKAWLDREHWPARMQQRIAEYRMNDVNWFLARVNQMVYLRGLGHYAKVTGWSAA